ncbi:hypothetical protein ACWAUP_000339 [Pseudomonas aeruginosa]
MMSDDADVEKKTNDLDEFALGFIKSIAGGIAGLIVGAIFGGSEGAAVGGLFGSFVAFLIVFFFAKER